MFAGPIPSGRGLAGLWTRWRAPAHQGIAQLPAKFWLTLEDVERFANDCGRLMKQAARRAACQGETRREVVALQAQDGVNPRVDVPTLGTIFRQIDSSYSTPAWWAQF